MGFSDIEKDIESIDESSIEWAEEKEKSESREKAVQSAIARLQEDTEMSAVVDEKKKDILHEKEKINEKLDGYTHQIESIQRELYALIEENEESGRTLLKLKDIGEDVEEGLSILEERRQFIDECIVRLQEIKSRLGLDEYMQGRSGHDSANSEKFLNAIPGEEDTAETSGDRGTDNFEEAGCNVDYGGTTEPESHNNMYPDSVPSFVAPDYKSATGNYQRLKLSLKASGIDYNVIKPYGRYRTTDEIVRDLCGDDHTGGCSSLALAYAANKIGYHVTDFRGGMSWVFFANPANVEQIAGLSGVVSEIVYGTNDYDSAYTLLQKVEEGKDYILVSGKHAAIVRKHREDYEYLELQHPVLEDNKWYGLDHYALKNRFHCRRWHMKNRRNFLIDVDTLSESQEFLDLLGYINTSK